jgi:hypothetical protein
MARQRFRQAMEADAATDSSDAGETAGSDKPAAGDASSAPSDSAPVRDMSTDGGVNGRVSSGH